MISPPTSRFQTDPLPELPIAAGEMIEVAKTVDQVSALRGAWPAGDLNSDIDFYLAVLKSRQIVRPHVSLLRSNGRPASFLVGRLELKPFVLPLGYKKVPLLTVRCLTLGYDGLLGDTSDISVSKLVGSVVSSLRNGDADLAHFEYLDHDSTILRIVRQAGGALQRDLFPTWVDRWSVRLPRSYAEFIGHLSRNTRHNLKRYSKRFQDAFGERITIKQFRGPMNIGTVLSDCEVIARNTYHRGLGVGFMNDDETHRLMTLAAHHAWLRAYILYIDGKPSAFWNGCLYRRTFYTWTTGYDPSYRDFRPGMFLLQRLIEDLCQDGVTDTIDFGLGTAQYKNDLCDQSRRLASIFLFAPTLRGLGLNALRTPLMVGEHAARRLLIETGLLQRTKTLWKRRLEGNKRESSD